MEKESKPCIEHETKKIKLTGRETLTLFLVMLKIGATCFGGGWSIVAQMDEEFIQKRQWMTSEELMNCAVMSKGLPGIMIMNTSVLFSYRIAGLPGAILSVLGCAIPSIVTVFILASIYNAVCSNPFVVNALTGVRASVVAVVASVCIMLWKIAFVDLFTICIAAIAFAICFTDVSKAFLVIAAVGMGVIDYFIRKRRAKKQ